MTKDEKLEEQINAIAEDLRSNKDFIRDLKQSIRELFPRSSYELLKALARALEDRGCQIMVVSILSMPQGLVITYKNMQATIGIFPDGVNLFNNDPHGVVLFDRTKSGSAIVDEILKTMTDNPDKYPITDQQKENK